MSREREKEEINLMEPKKKKNLVVGGAVDGRALQVVHFMNAVVTAKHVAHDDAVCFLVRHRDAIHAQVLRQQGLAVALNHIL